MELRIKEVLKEKGITSQELANRLNCSPVWMSQIYKGNPTISRLEQIAEALNCRVADLLDEEKPEERPFMVCPHCGKKIYLEGKKE